MALVAKPEFPDHRAGSGQENGAGVHRWGGTGFGRAGVIFGAGFVLLSVAVRLGLLDAIDRQLADVARPDAVWLTAQQRVSPWVWLFGPEHVAAGLAIVLAVVVVARGSLRPVVLPVAVTVVGAAAGALAKFAVGRPDVQGNIYSHGSFPSGHTLTVVLAAGLTLLLIWPEPRWWHLLLPIVPGVLMGTGLVIIGMHWAGDALGSILLGECLIAVAAAWSGTSRSAHRNRADAETPAVPAHVGGGQ